ncbi:MAG: lipopolysaccharide biosynthesis protein [Candidatus Heimdallarchaeota archaeon]
MVILKTPKRIAFVLISSQKLLKGTSFYALGQIVVIGGGFLLLPIYAYYLAPDEFGIIGIVMATSNILGTILILGLPSAQYRFYAELRRKKEDLGNFLFSINSSVLALNSIVFGLLLFTPLGLIFFNLLVSQDKMSYMPYMGLIILLIFLGIAKLLATSFFVADQRITLVVVVDLLQFVINAALSLYFIIFLEMGAVGQILGTVLALFLGPLPLYLLYFKRINPKLELGLVFQSFKIGFPLAITSLFGALLSTANILIIQKIVSLNDAGLYSIALSLGSVIGIVTVSFNNAWMTPFNDLMLSYELGSDEVRTNAALRKSFSSFLLMICTFCLILETFSKEGVFLLLKPKYHELTKFLPIMFVGFLGSGLTLYWVNFYIFYKRTHWIPFFRFIGLLLNILLNLLITPHFGLLGAAYIFAVTNIIIFLLTYIGCTKLFYNPKINHIKTFIPLMFIANPIYFIVLGSNGFLFLLLRFLYLIFYFAIIFLIYRNLILGIVNNLFHSYFQSS